jgi:hypothetical protein
LPQVQRIFETNWIKDVEGFAGNFLNNMSGYGKRLNSIMVKIDRRKRKGLEGNIYI